MRDGLLSRGFGRNDRVGTEGEISPDPIGVDDAASSKAPHSGSLPRFWNLESRSDSNGNRLHLPRVNLPHPRADCPECPQGLAIVSESEGRSRTSALESRMRQRCCSNRSCLGLSVLPQAESGCALWCLTHSLDIDHLQHKRDLPDCDINEIEAGSARLGSPPGAGCATTERHDAGGSAVGPSIAGDVDSITQLPERRRSWRTPYQRRKLR